MIGGKNSRAGEVKLKIGRVPGVCRRIYRAFRVTHAGKQGRPGEALEFSLYCQPKKLLRARTNPMF